jgi:imidazolonepropionase-like amidohydrolase
MSQMRKMLWLCALALLCSLPAIKAQTNTEKTYALRNGQWFDGKTFKAKTFYVVKGLLAERAPKQIDETIDLKNGFVIPPFGDAHCHHFDGEYGLDQLIKTYLNEGIFYAKVPGNTAEGARAVSGKLHRPDSPSSLDVLYANGALTGSYSHPMGTYEPLALGVPWNQWREQAERITKSRLAEGKAYFTLDNIADLEQKWPRLLATKPGFIKIILTGSENYERDKDKIGVDVRRGLPPALVPLVVERAHAAGLRVAAHVDTAADFHLALTAGVDEMAHMPGYGLREEEDAQKYELSESDVKLAAQRKVAITPTANRAAFDPPSAKRKATQLSNLRLLKKYGVPVLIGTDSYGTSASLEAFYLNALGIYSNLELLKLWCETTPQNIFPQRKLGRLQPGYEASFLVLSANPLDRFENIKQIALRVKQGKLLR